MDIVSLATGISLFLYAMLLLSSSMKKNCTGKSERFLTGFTSNRFSAVLTGSVFTALMQSSSASSVMTISLVDAKKLNLITAFWIIVGANIGSAFTGVLTAFEFSEIAPLFCVVGIILLSVSKKEKVQDIALAFLGFGLLFVGMNLMSLAVEGLKNNPRIISIFKECSKPLSGIVCGAAVTAVLQSSAAVTAILQTMAYGGLIGLREAFFISLGANIGTCVTSLIATIGVNKTAKKVSLLHFAFNVLSAVLFVVLCVPFDLVKMIENIFIVDIKTQIAFVNILFNVLPAVLTLCLPVNSIQKAYLYFVEQNKSKHTKKKRHFGAFCSFSF